MKKGIFALMLMFCAGLLVLSACGGKDKDKDADADVGPDIQPDRDIPAEQDIPDIPVEPDVGPEITPDIPADTPTEPTECGQLHGGECNIVDNCGCDPGQTCTLNANPSDTCNIIEMCVAGAGTLPSGSECDPANDQCMPGNSCLTNSVTHESNCYKWCINDTDCEAGHSCNIQISFDMGPDCPDPVTPLYKACDLGCPADAGCDPFTGTGCTAPNNACLYDTSCQVLFCAPAGTTAVGEDCATTQSCELGAECFTIDDGATFQCYAFCDDAHPCEGTCSPLGYPTNPSLGACIPG